MIIATDCGEWIVCDLLPGFLSFCYLSVSTTGVADRPQPQTRPLTIGSMCVLCRFRTLISLGCHCGGKTALNQRHVFQKYHRTFLKWPCIYTLLLKRCFHVFGRNQSRKGGASTCLEVQLQSTGIGSFCVIPNG